MKHKSTHQWGRDTAKERYSQPQSHSLGGSDPGSTTEPQCPNDKHGANYDNDTPDTWLRGGGSKGAEGKPSFDKRHKA